MVKSSPDAAFLEAKSTAPTEKGKSKSGEREFSVTVIAKKKQPGEKSHEFSVMAKNHASAIALARKEYRLVDSERAVSFQVKLKK